MAFPIKTCVSCGDEFELRPGKPGFANRCPSCSEPESSEPETVRAGTDTADRNVDRRIEAERDAFRRRAMRDMLYRKDS